MKKRIRLKNIAFEGEKAALNTKFTVTLSPVPLFELLEEKDQSADMFADDEMEKLGSVVKKDRVNGRIQF